MISAMNPVPSGDKRRARRVICCFPAGCEWPTGATWRFGAGIMRNLSAAGGLFELSAPAPGLRPGGEVVLTLAPGVLKIDGRAITLHGRVQRLEIAATVKAGIRFNTVSAEVSAILTDPKATHA